MPYQIHSAEDLGAHLTPVRIVAVADRELMVARAGASMVMIPLGVDLCSSCDEQVTSAPCACERRA
jgi:hypothetical protein